MRRKKGLVLLALLALAAFTITATVGGSASAAGGAVAAKKKCKKKNHASSAKKKRCKKRKNVPPVSVVRAKLTWSNGENPNADVDLFVFDSSGRTAGNGSDAIPASDLSPDVTGAAGSETFTDLNANQKRPFSFGVCYSNAGSAHVDYTITYVTADGVSHTDTRNLGSDDRVDYSADGVPIPSYCTT